MAMSVSTMTSTVSDADVMGRQANYEPYLRRYEAEATALGNWEEVLKLHCS
jgi:hypothetical protein